MFAAGTETTPAVVEWAMSEIIENPRVMEKAQLELRQSSRKTKIAEESVVHELSYLKLVIKETLRLHPPGPLLAPRECTEPREINEFTIPVKTKVIVNAWAIARDPELWEDGDKFTPERFEKNMIEYNGNNFEYIPFGVGRRICPGLSFGLATIELVLAQLLYHFNWKLPDRMKPDELDMTHVPGVSSRRKTPLYLVADLSEATLV